VSLKNVEIVRDSLEHLLASGELQWTALHPATEVRDHDILDASDYRGHAGVTQWLGDWATAWSEYTLKPSEYIDAGDHVVVVFWMNATGRGSGVRVERRDAMVCQVHDGQIVRIDYYNNRDEALKAMGLI
jgi:ketosteroid isomerase-like protein